jgi:hypothetical protein
MGLGQLGPDQAVQTERGERAFAAGDRIMFQRNERALGGSPGGRGGVAVKNGTLGTVLAGPARGLCRADPGTATGWRCTTGATRSPAPRRWRGRWGASG